jgi:transcriptional regulator with XRE-family HTH domain
MSDHQVNAELALPKSWTKSVKSAVLQVISLVQFTITASEAEAIENKNANPFEVELERLEHEIACLREEMRIKDQRMGRVSAHRRPQYKAIERLEILELRTMRGWSLRQTADAFLLAPATVASWMKRADEDGPHALLELREPVNKFPEFVQYAMKRFKTLCPTLGKKKIAGILCRAGLHLAVSTVGRMLNEKSNPAHDDGQCGTNVDENQEESESSPDSQASNSLPGSQALAWEPTAVPAPAGSRRLSPGVQGGSRFREAGASKTVRSQAEPGTESNSQCAESLGRNNPHASWAGHLQVSTISHGLPKM